MNHKCHMQPVLMSPLPNALPFTVLKRFNYRGGRGAKNSCTPIALLFKWNSPYYLFFLWRQTIPLKSELFCKILITHLLSMFLKCVSGVLFKGNDTNWRTIRRRTLLLLCSAHDGFSLNDKDTTLLKEVYNLRIQLFHFLHISRVVSSSFSLKHLCANHSNSNDYPWMVLFS